MNKRVITARYNDSVFAAAWKIRENHIGAVIIIDNKNMPFGILTESDVLNALIKNDGNLNNTPTERLYDFARNNTLPRRRPGRRSSSSAYGDKRDTQDPVTENGKITGIISYRDLTEDLRKSHYILDKLIEEKANKDPLTNLFNRGYALEQLRYQFDLTKRINNLLVNYMFDADHFKKVNVTYGHPCGGRVLKTIAYILRASSRTLQQEPYRRPHRGSQNFYKMKIRTGCINKFIGICVVILSPGTAPPASPNAL